MKQIFHRSTNTIARVSIFGALIVIAGIGWIGAEISRSPYVTQVQVAREQPVPFSHKHHVAGLGIDCRYCHTSVEDTAFAGIPSTQTCMGCHSEIWADSPMLEPVRESYRTDRSLEWVRIHLRERSSDLELFYCPTRCATNPPRLCQELVCPQGCWRIRQPARRLAGGVGS